MDMVKTKIALYCQLLSHIIAFGEVMFALDDLQQMFFVSIYIKTAQSGSIALQLFFCRTHYGPL